MNPARHGGIRLRPNGGLIQCFGRAPTGQLQASPGQSPGSSIAQRKSPEGATQNPAQIPLIQATTHRRMSNHAMATHCKLVRPFRAFSGMHDLPKALPWTAIRLPLRGVKDNTATRSNHPWITAVHGPNSRPFWEVPTLQGPAGIPSLGHAKFRYPFLNSNSR